MTGLLENTIEVSLIVFTALAVTTLLRQRSAALRHLVVAVALACASATPLLGLAAPTWHLGVGAWWPAPPADEPRVSLAPPRPEDAVPVQSRAFAPPGTASSSVVPHVSSQTLLVGSWIAGLMISLAFLIVGGARLASAAARSRRVVDGPWVENAAWIARSYGLRRDVVILQCEDPRLLVTWGLRQPKIILPASALAWPEDRVRLVLYHELAHVRRGDWIVQLGAELLRAIYWFNPLVWLASARLRHESERACDDVVLARGVDGSEYAAHLVEIARDLRQRRMWTAAPAMARTSSLERRVKAMLDDRLNRLPVSRSARVTTLGAMLAVTMAVAGFAASQTFSTLTGSIVDMTNAALPAVSLTLTNVDSKAKYEVQSDRTGRYEFVGLPSGEYVLETRLPGFRPLQTKVTVAGRNLQQDMMLQVGSLQETVSVVGGPSDTGVAALPDPEKQRLVEERRAKREAARCPGGPATDVRIGGNLRPPMKLRHVSPAYPASLRGSGLEGTVVLHARIGTEGDVDEVTVLSSTHDDFTSAASEAVRQWQFDATLLNCVAVPVDMTVTVNFSYRP